MHTLPTPPPTGGRDGRGKTDDGKLDLALSLPKEMGGDNKGTNRNSFSPLVILRAILAPSSSWPARIKVTIAPDASITAHVGVGPREDGGGFGLEVALDVNLPGVDKAVAKDIADKAHVVCPYSMPRRATSR